MLLDLGSGALGTLHRYVDPLSIDAVLFSHLHADHYFDLSGLYVMWKYHPDGARAAGPGVGPARGRRPVRPRLRPRPGDRACRPSSTSTSTTTSRSGSARSRSTAVRVVHPVAAYGLRVEADGRVLAYSGDTGPCQELVDLAAGADLLLCEAAFVEGGDNPVDLHLTGEQAGAPRPPPASAGSCSRTSRPWTDRAEVDADAKTDVGR